MFKNAAALSPEPPFPPLAEVERGSGAEPAAPWGSLSVWTVLLKTLRHCFPDLISWFSRVPDPRDPRFTVYPIAYVLVSGVFLFLTKLGSRRQMRYQFATSAFVANLNYLCGTSMETMVHPDTLAILLKRIDEDALGKIRHAMVGRLIRNKCFEKERLLGAYYRVAIDGSGHLVFSTRHCPHCLTQKHGSKTIYYHPVLEAKLVTPSGFCLSIGTEFIENPQEYVDKQDCERKAFVRLAKRLKREFPQLRICLLLDALYACGPVYELCRSYNWRYIITFKEGSAPSVFAEYEQLKQISAKAYSFSVPSVQQTYWWVHGIEWGDHRVNVLECLESTAKQSRTRYVWVTDLAIHEKNYEQLGNRGGRVRWKIENEGFNMQKTNGYEMEHVYCEHPRAAKNFYLLLQIAHILAQLMEKGLLARAMKKVLGAIRNVARWLLEELRRESPNLSQLHQELAGRIQIRFDSS